MDLKNGYKVMYEAKERITQEKPGPLYASKSVPAVTDAMLISYANGVEYVDCKTFKLIYSDGKYIYGSVSGIPSENDVKIVLKAGNEVVFGEIETVPVTLTMSEHIVSYINVGGNPVIDKAPKGGSVVIKYAAAEGYQLKDAADQKVTVNGVETVATISDGFATIPNVTANGALVISIVAPTKTA